MKAFLKRCNTRVLHLAEDHLVTYCLACFGFGSIVGKIVKWVS